MLLADYSWYLIYQGSDIGENLHYQQRNRIIGTTILYLQKKYDYQTMEMQFIDQITLSDSNFS